MPTAYFFMADISGYTAYLTGTELDHAQEILNTLFETLLNSLQPPLNVAKIEGDAIFAYLPAEQVCYGQTILDTVESMYAGFRKVQKVMHLNTTCRCRACQGINSLDLKFFVHYGEYIVQRLRGQEELAGPAVILAHRLMKNTVAETTGIKAYALFSAAAIQAMRAQAVAATFMRHTENYEHLGSIDLYIYDLHPFWERDQVARREFITPQQASASATITVPAPPAVVWDIYTNPATRGRVLAGDVTVDSEPNGRMGPGATYHCAHHDGSSTEELILDWHPLEYITSRELALDPGMNVIFTMTSWIEPQPDNTSRVTLSVSSPQAENPMQQAMLEAIWPEIIAGMVQHIESHAVEAFNEILAERGYPTGPH